jgi:glycosyltransferase involved in cell wall biosynthesis
MKFLLIGECSTKRATGYETILDGLATELTRRGHRVVVLGQEYSDGAEHDRPYVVLSTNGRVVADQVTKLLHTFAPDVYVGVGDMSWQVAFQQYHRGSIPYVGIFATEGAPLLYPSKWASGIESMNVKFTISDFGAATCQESIPDVKHLLIGVDSFWSPPSPERRSTLRAELGVTDQLVILTVADNHERKNFPAAFKAVGELREAGVDAFYVVVTKRRPGIIGWDLWALARSNGLHRHAFVFDEGCSRERLRDLYGLADCLLITSKAEGLCLPVLEAMACGTPSIVSNLCSLPELVADGRGYTIDPEYWYTDPFGNNLRAFVNAHHAASLLSTVASDPDSWDECRRRGLEYAATRTWSRTTDQFIAEVENAITRKRDEEAERERRVIEYIRSRTGAVPS